MIMILRMNCDEETISNIAFHSRAWPSAEADISNIIGVGIFSSERLAAATPAIGILSTSGIHITCPETSFKGHNSIVYEQCTR